MGKIILKEIEFIAFHGRNKEEQEKGGNFLVDISVVLDTKKAAASDNLKDAVDYQLFYQIAKREMEKRSYLVENVCQRIIDSVMNEVPEVKKVKVKVSKLNPPMGGKMKSVSVVLTKKRKND